MLPAWTNSWSAAFQAQFLKNSMFWWCFLVETQGCSMRVLRTFKAVRHKFSFLHNFLVGEEFKICQLIASRKLWTKDSRLFLAEGSWSNWSSSIQLARTFFMLFRQKFSQHAESKDFFSMDQNCYIVRSFGRQVNRSSFGVWMLSGYLVAI